MTVLRQRMTEDMQVRNLSPHTQASYLQQVSLFARYFRMSPDALTPEHIRTYQIYLTNEKRLAPNQEGLDLWRRHPASKKAAEATRRPEP
jgi:integrase/recombinase XerD